MADRLYVHRTQSLEALLQELWALRPELKDKPSMTVYMGMAALIREVKLSAAVMNRSMAPLTPTVMSTPASDSNANISAKSDAAVFAELDLGDPHPNEQWD